MDDNGVIYAGSPNYSGNNTAVFKTSNGGQSWIPAYNGLGSAGITGLATQGDAIYASTYNLTARDPNLTEGVFKTTDGGGHWTLMNSGLDYRLVNSITATHLTLYAGTRGGVYQSSNGGNNWSASNTGITGMWITSLLALPNGYVYAGTSSGGLYQSNA